MSISGEGPRFGCPECGSERVEEQGNVACGYLVASWDEDGTPADYDELKIYDDCGYEVDATHPYYCKACGHEFSKPKRLL